MCLIFFFLCHVSKLDISSPLFHRIFFTFIYVENYIPLLIFYVRKASETDVGCQCQDVPYHPWMCLQLFVSFQVDRLPFIRQNGQRMDAHKCGRMTSQAGSLVSCKCNLALD
jgi:hypothetical protein